MQLSHSKFLTRLYIAAAVVGDSPTTSVCYIFFVHLPSSAVTLLLQYHAMTVSL